MKDVARFEDGVNKLVTYTINQNQFDALVDFSFNLGLGNLGSSTLLKKLNAGDIKGAAEEFLRWDKAGGKVLAGLTKRRKAERDLFLA
jgi:lysozyme